MTLGCIWKVNIAYLEDVTGHNDGLGAGWIDLVNVRALLCGNVLYSVATNNSDL